MKAAGLYTGYPKLRNRTYVCQECGQSYHQYTVSPLPEGTHYCAKGRQSEQIKLAMEAAWKRYEEATKC